MRREQLRARAPGGKLRWEAPSDGAGEHPAQSPGLCMNCSTRIVFEQSAPIAICGACGAVNVWRET